VKAARRHGRVVQLGTQQRTMVIFQKAIDLIHSGKLGTITNATCWLDMNGWGAGETRGPVPEGLDWDMWLGPAPWEPYSAYRHYGFMGCHDYARGGQLTNWGVHLMDIVHWGIREDRPLSVQALGGSFLGGAGADNYSVIEVLFEYKGCTVTWEQRPKDVYVGHGYGIKFQGTEGQLLVDRNTFDVLPESLGIPRYVGEPERSWAHPPHHNNFFECVRTRKRPICDADVAHRSASALLLGGIAKQVQRTLKWDPEAEQFIGDQEADRLLSIAKRPPWRV
jgi:predicted dehydrogenase